MPVIICILMMAAFSNLSFAQSDDVSDKKEKLESMKVAFITQKLKLSPDEAKIFWPVYNQYQDELERTRANWKKESSLAKGNYESMSDKEVEKLVDGEIAFRQNELDVKKKFHVQLKKVLSMKKLAMLYKTEDEFKRELLKKLQEKSSQKN